jgi:hypothetical protein
VRSITVEGQVKILNHRQIFKLKTGGGLRSATDTEASKPSTEMLALVIDGCLYALLGGPASNAFRTYVKKQYSANVADLVDDPEKLQKCLGDVFGDSATIIEDFIMKSLLREFELPAALCVDLASTLKAAKA